LEVGNGKLGLDSPARGGVLEGDIHPYEDEGQAHDDVEDHGLHEHQYPK